MKNIFAYKRMKNEPPIFNGKQFLIKEVGERLIGETFEFTERQKDTAKKFSLPAPIRLLALLTFTGGLVMLLIVLERVSASTFYDAFSEVAALFILCPVCMIGGGAILIVNRSIIKRGKASDDMLALENDAETLFKKSEEELEVPSSALKVDVIARYYKEKENGKISSFGSAFMLEQHSVFVQNEAVCFSDLFTVVSVPLSSVKGVKFIKKRVVCVGGWNKEEPVKNPKYKKHVLVNSYGQLYVKSHYVIEVSDVRGDYEILIPTYDFELFSEATGYRIVCDKTA